MHTQTCMYTIWKRYTNEKIMYFNKKFTLKITKTKKDIESLKTNWVVLMKRK